MADAPFALLFAVGGSLVGVGLLLLAVASMPRRLGLLFAHAAWWMSTWWLVQGAVRILDVGKWSDVQLTGFQGAQLVAEGPGGMLFTLRAKGALLLLLLHLAVGAVLWLAPVLRGGGHRRDPRPLPLAGVGCVLLALGGLDVVVMGGVLPTVLAGAVLSSCAALGMLLLERPERDGANAASQVFMVHVVADAFLLAATVVMVGLANSAHPLESLITLLQSKNVVVEAGPFVGFPTSWIRQLLVVLLAVGLGLRSAPIGLVSFWQKAKGGSFVVLHVAHHLAWTGATVLLVDQLTPLLRLSPIVADVLGLVLVVGAGWHTLHLLVSRHLDDALLHAPLALASLAMASFVTGNATSAVVFCLLAWVGGVAVAAALSTVVERTHSVDVRQLGGLEPALPRSESATALWAATLTALPGSGLFLGVLPLVTDGVVRGGLRLAMSVVVLVPTLALCGAALRLWWGTFSGDELRDIEVVDDDQELRLRTKLLPSLLALLTVLTPLLVALPRRAMQLLMPGFRPPLPSLLAPEDRVFAVVETTLAGLPPPIPTGYELTAALLLALMALVVVVVVAKLFRKQWSPRADAFAAHPTVTTWAGRLQDPRLPMRLWERVLVGPVERLAKTVWGYVYPVVVEGGLHQVFSIPLSFAGFLLRVFNNGDVQRGLALMLLVGGGLLSWWSLR